MNETKPPTATTDDLKRLADPRIWMWIECDPSYSDVAHCTMDDLCERHRAYSELLAANRAKDKRIEKLRAAIDLRLDTYRRFRYEKFLASSVIADFEAALAADEAAQRKG